MSRLISRPIIFAAIVLTGWSRSNCQSALPEVFVKGALNEQMKYLNERTRIYENYRAIREDIYQSFSKNILDSLHQAERRIKDLSLQRSTLGNKIDSLNFQMLALQDELSEKTRTKDSIGLLGIEVNKRIYNSVMWITLGSLVFLLISGYLVLRRYRYTMLKARLDLIELKDEFEGYRQKTRLEREQMTRDHFNEIKKLKGK